MWGRETDAACRRAAGPWVRPASGGAADGTCALVRVDGLRFISGGPAEGPLSVAPDGGSADVDTLWVLSWIGQRAAGLASHVRPTDMTGMSRPEQERVAWPDGGETDWP
jgi:hypothetical protein